jgi:hypothetical protein
VNGMLMEIADDTNNKETAIPSDFLSGLAKATILRKEETLIFCEFFLRNGKSRNSKEGLDVD